MIDKIKGELIPLTRELAIRFSQMKPMPGERAKRGSRLKYFNHKLRAGDFLSPTWAVAIVNGEEYRADGQHTSTALATCSEELFPDNIGVTINTYRLDSMADAPTLFETFDNPISARSNTDKLGVYVAHHQEFLEIDRTYLSRVSRGIDYYYRDLAKEADSQRQLTLWSARDHGLYFEQGPHRQFAIWLHSWRQSHHVWMIGKPGIVAEIFADWLSYPIMAERFWGEVFTESNPDSEDDTRELSRVLKEWSKRPTRMKQDKYRAKAHKIWDRYKRLFNTTPKPGDAPAPPTEEQAA